MATILQQAVENRAFPGAVWRVYQADQVLYEETVGSLTYESDERVTFQTRYDLASVTKPFISFAVLLLADRGLISLEESASSYLKELDTEEKRRITVSQLLLHTAGLVSNPELHKTYSDKESLYGILFSHPVTARPGEKVAYTSIGYQFLGYIVERVSGMNLADFLRKEIFEPLGLKTIRYLPGNKEGIAPTEFSVFRNRLLQGEVHDDNCYLLGGIQGHAGLFSDVEDVCTFGRMLVSGNPPLVSEKSLQSLFVNLTGNSGQKRSCGFIINEPIFGKWNADTAVHTGFTGTSLFMVPEKKIVSVLLANRVYPTRENEKINEVRHQLHTWLREMVEGQLHE